MNNLQIDFEKKLESCLSDENILKVMNKASRSFKSHLDADEIYTCQINALWKAIKNYNPSKKTKFTTYLYAGVIIECIKNVKFNSKHSKQTTHLHYNSHNYYDDNTMFYLLDEIENETEATILKMRSERRTIEDIGGKLGISRETVRKKIKKIESRIISKFK
jgi:RNA polymerase sigma factor (sigma-70 family)